MATALRFVARKICSRALELPRQPRVSAAASSVLKEEQRLLFPRISHVGSSLRRFSTSEPPNRPDNTKLLPFEAKSGFSRRIEETKHELLDLLLQMEGESSMGNEQKELQRLLQRSSNRALASLYDKVTGGAIFAATVTVLVGYGFIFGWKENNRENNSY